MSSHDDRPTDETTPVPGHRGPGPAWRDDPAEDARGERSTEPTTTEPATTEPATTEPTTTEPTTTEPTGPSWPTVTLGLVCLAVAVAVLVLQTVDLTVDWRLAGPLALAGIGALVAVVGAVGVVLGGRR